MDRREVLKGSCAVCVVGAAGVVAGCSPSPTPSVSPPETQTPGEVRVKPEDIPVGGGVILEEEAVVVTRPAEREIRAFSAVCTHQGCLVAEVVDSEIRCLCHGSRFSIEDGSVIGGPARGPLPPVEVAVDAHGW